MMASVASMTLPPTGMRSGRSRLVPRIVPPRVRMPESAASSRGTTRFSMMPRKPSRKPMTCIPKYPLAALPTARMAALRPGLSPPEVRRPMCFFMCLRARRPRLKSAPLRLREPRNLRHCKENSFMTRLNCGAMNYKLKPGEELDAGIRRIARKQVAHARALLGRGGGESGGESIHEARKWLKKIRALLRLVRPALDIAEYRRQNEASRGAAR